MLQTMGLRFRFRQDPEVWDTPSELFLCLDGVTQFQGSPFLRPHEWCKVEGNAVFKASPGGSGGILWVSFEQVINILLPTGCRRMPPKDLGILIVTSANMWLGHLPQRKGACLCDRAEHLAVGKQLRSPRWTQNIKEFVKGVWFSAYRLRIRDEIWQTLRMGWGG